MNCKQETSFGRFVTIGLLPLFFGGQNFSEKLINQLHMQYEMKKGDKYFNILKHFGLGYLLY